MRYLVGCCACSIPRAGLTFSGLPDSIGAEVLSAPPPVPPLAPRSWIKRKTLKGLTCILP